MVFDQLDIDGNYAHPEVTSVQGSFFIGIYDIFEPSLG